MRKAIYSAVAGAIVAVCLVAAAIAGPVWPVTKETTEIQADNAL